MLDLIRRYEAAKTADDLYQLELERVYGRKAGDARYDRRKNAATPKLAELRAAFIAAQADRHAACMKMVKRPLDS